VWAGVPWGAGRGADVGWGLSGHRAGAALGVGWGPLGSRQGPLHTWAGVPQGTKPGSLPGMSWGAPLRVGWGPLRAQGRVPAQPWIWVPIQLWAGVPVWVTGLGVPVWGWVRVSLGLGSPIPTTRGAAVGPTAPHPPGSAGPSPCSPLCVPTSPLVPSPAWGGTDRGHGVPPRCGLGSPPAGARLRGAWRGFIFNAPANRWRGSETGVRQVTIPSLMSPQTHQIQVFFFIFFPPGDAPEQPGFSAKRERRI